MNMWLTLLKAQKHTKLHTFLAEVEHLQYGLDFLLPIEIPPTQCTVVQATIFNSTFQPYSMQAPI